MKIIYHPQRADGDLDYAFAGEAITVTMNGITETFDFSGMPDGMAEAITPARLPKNPFMAVERINGDLTVQVIHWYGRDAEDWEKEIREVIV